MSQIRKGDLVAAEIIGYVVKCRHKSECGDYVTVIEMPSDEGGASTFIEVRENAVVEVLKSARELRRLHGR
jgi:hypothetical protein